MPARKSIEDKLQELEATSAEETPAARTARLRKALEDRHYRVVAKAARLCTEGLQYDLIPDLRAAYRRFLGDKPAKLDPNCIAKTAVAGTLVDLDCDDTAFYLEGLRYRQPEPVYGGTMDTAVEIRCSCAMGLVSCGYSRALVELAELLHDPESGARVGAARAIACGNPREAELLLRCKVLSGDEEPPVIGECLSGLLAVQPEEAPRFVARYLQAPDEAVRELAALALGESRLDAALAALIETWNDPFLRSGLRGALLQAAVLHRSEASIDWLLSLAATAHAQAAENVVQMLSVYKQNSKLKTRLQAVVEQRGDRTLQQSFLALWN